jgi:Fic family protein
MNDEKIIEVWKPINFSDDWRVSDTTKLDDLLPSWYRKREDMKEGGEDYEEFINRLKRQHAIETGVIEKLYDLSEGITQTFIKEGFVESYLQHGDTNISPKKLMAHLKDHFEAMDFIFDMVRNERPLTKSFIKQLHQLITSHQDTTDAIDSLGRIVQVPLRKGEFKIHPNNPKREDGTIFQYCPPVHVEGEIDRLIEIYYNLESEKVNPVIIATWFHHAFTQIHPFQDGNGRMARLLASLILIKHGLFPLTVKRDDKARYIDSLEMADNGQPNDIVKLFSELQKKNIEGILNWKPEQKQTSNIQEAAKILSEKVTLWKSNQRKQRQLLLEKNRTRVFEIIYDSVGSIQKELFKIIPKEKASISIRSTYPSDENHFWYTKQIIDFAASHDYYFNRILPRGWFKFGFKLSDEKQYDLVISVHHYSYDDSIIAIGGFLEFKEQQVSENGAQVEDVSYIPLAITPYTFSLEADPNQVKKNIESYINDLVALGMSYVASEII